jgi:hypothetical protein
MSGPTRAQVFRQLQDFMEHDAKNVLRMEHGGNYTAALLLSVGAEALSLLQDEDPNTTLVAMFAPYNLGQPVTLGIQDAVRDGLAHLFETKYVVIDGTKIELVISWGALEHLSVRKEPLGLVLNVQTMWTDLRAQFQRVADRLERDPRWSKQVPKRWREGPVFEVRSKEAVAGWKALLRSRGVDL